MGVGMQALSADTASNHRTKVDFYHGSVYYGPRFEAEKDLMVIDGTYDKLEERDQLRADYANYSVGQTKCISPHLGISGPADAVRCMAFKVEMTPYTPYAFKLFVIHVRFGNYTTMDFTLHDSRHQGHELCPRYHRSYPLGKTVTLTHTGFSLNIAIDGQPVFNITGNEPSEAARYNWQYPTRQFRLNLAGKKTIEWTDPGMQSAVVSMEASCGTRVTAEQGDPPASFGVQQIMGNIASFTTVDFENDDDWHDGQTPAKIVDFVYLANYFKIDESARIVQIYPAGEFYDEQQKRNAHYLSTKVRVGDRVVRLNFTSPRVLDDGRFDPEQVKQMSEHLLTNRAYEFTVATEGVKRARGDGAKDTSNAKKACT